AMPVLSTPRVQVRASNHWKTIGVVVACLVVVAGLAAVFQRKPSELATETPTPQAAPAPAQPTPVQVSEPEPTPDDSATELDQVLASAGVVRKNRVARAPRTKTPGGPAAPQEGEIGVSSTPADARIEIEGVAQSWNTPQVVTALQVGTYKVTVSKTGFAPEVRTVQIPPGGRASMDVRLTVVKGFLTVA